MKFAKELLSPIRRALLASSLLLLAGVAAAQPPAAGTWPTRSVRIIVGYPAGSSPDLQARMLAEPLSKALGQAVVVENRPGAGGNIGADTLAKSQGAQGINIEVWNAVMAPAGMPAAHQARLNAELGKILGSREIRQKLFLQGWKDQDPSAAALARRIQSDTAVYSKLISSKGIKIDG